MTESLEGGCLCGAVRYRIAGEIRDAGHCHCRMCQRAGGAPMVTWLTVAAQDFRVTAGELAGYRSSGSASRRFCGACGSQIVFAPDKGETVDVTVATLDEPDRVRPVRQTWVSSRLHMMRGFDTELPASAEE